MALWQAPLERGRIWQPRFYVLVVFSEPKRVEKLRYTHRNPVKRGLVLDPHHWAAPVGMGAAFAITPLTSPDPCW